MNLHEDRAWDDFDVYLFDIDGTLMNSADAVHYFAFCEALSAVAGRSLNLDGVIAHGNVDVGILRDAWTLADVPESAWRPHLAETLAGMGRFVEARQDDLRLEVLPGVVEVLTHLRTRGKLLAVATGNLERIGRVKLERAGLLRFFDFGGYSDHFEFRRDVFAGTVEQARRLAAPDASILVLGDTPEDVRAAHANGLPVYAVATGIYPRAQLEAEQPTRCLASMLELAPTLTT